MASRKPVKMTGLEPPLPEGTPSRSSKRPASVNPREQNSQTQSNPRAVLRKKPRTESASQDLDFADNDLPSSTDAADDTLTQHKKELHIKFDGACRGNGTNRARSAFGVFSTSYTHFLTCKGAADVDTNNAAEIVAAIQTFHALITHFQRLVDIGITTIIIMGDSLHVCAALCDRRLHFYRPASGHPNCHLWCQLADLQKRLDYLCEEAGIEYDVNHIPRYFNIEPDELANSFLDNREPDTTLTSRTGTNLDVDTLLQQLLPLLHTRRCRTIRQLPDSLSIEWTRLLEQLWQHYPRDTAITLFLVLPHLLSVRTSSIANRYAYGLVRDHLACLMHPAYLADTIAATITTFEVVPQYPTCTEPCSLDKKIRTLCSRGLHAKCIKKQTIELADVKSRKVQLSVNALFPPAPTNVPPIPDVRNTDYEVNFGDVLKAIKRMKRGSSPGLLGWTRELLVAATFSNSKIVGDYITAVISMIASGQIPDRAASDLLCTSILHIFRYLDRDKLRPIAVLDVLVRLAARTQLGVIYQRHPELQRSLTTDCIATVRYVQEKISSRGDIAVCGDGTNCFNVLHRHPAFVELQKDKRYAPVCNMIYLLYSAESSAYAYDASGAIAFRTSIQTGTRQGCVLSRLFLHLATVHTERKLAPLIKPSVLKVVADDITVVGPNAVDAFEIVADAYRDDVNLDIRGAKLRQVSSGSPCAKLLGGLIVPNDCPRRSITTELERILKKAQDRVETVLSLPTSIMNKLAILRLLPTWLTYYLATWPLEATRDLWQRIDTLHFEAVKLIHGNVDIPVHHAHTINQPIEGGGYGIIPLAGLAPAIVNAAITHPTRHTKGKSLFHATSRIWITTTQSRNAKHTIPRRNWFTQWPTTKWSTVTDEEALTYFHMKFETLTKPHYYGCPNYSQHENWTDHWLGCGTCNTGLWWMRHETCIMAIMHTLRYWNIPCKLIASGTQPLPGRDKGGPDFKVFPHGLSEDVDVTIAKDVPTHNVIKQRSRLKTNKYEEYTKLTKRTFLPLVCTHLGAIDQQALSRMAEWATHATSPNQCYAALIAHTQIGILRGTTQALALFNQRHSTQQQGRTLQHPPNFNHVN